MASSQTPQQALTAAAMAGVQVRLAAKAAVQAHYTAQATPPAPAPTASPQPGTGGR